LGHGDLQLFVLYLVRYALILFAAVQITMIGGGLIAGERLRVLQWLGVALAMGGLVYLMLPSIALALKHLTAARAGIAQLTVPIIAAIGGILFIAEPFTGRFFIAMCATLAGVGLATFGPKEKACI